ncbi:DNRLRE domain-containing protein [Cerasicoccus frondis]|uniref:DNRLRE domain-containing protein n=1 Tax=Cerasicoccus frondis TaxID=490090 RepID=UPI002852CB77|nr:DNRLRE domain-containing protein [Cerasicoccus frondis]
MNNTPTTPIIWLARLAFLLLGVAAQCHADTLSITNASYVKDGVDANTNFGNASALAVAARGTSYNRKAYLEVDLTGLTTSQTWFSAASLTLTFYSSPLIGPAAGDVTFNIYGVVSDDAAWSESTITWDNAPLNDTVSASGLNPDGTVLLGSFTVDTSSIGASQQLTISGEFDNYLNWAVGKLGDYYGTQQAAADGNLATFIITSTGETSDPGVYFYSDDSGSAPYLSYTVGVPALSAPTLISPADDTVGYERFRAFTWSSVTGSSRYEIQISNSETFGLVVDQDIVELTRYVPLSALYPSARFWRVRALGEDGESGPWSAIFRYLLGEPANTQVVSPSGNWATTVNNLISNATGPIKIVFSAGNYVYAPTSAADVYPVWITNKEDVILEGQGAVITIQPAPVSGGHVIPGFVKITNSERITIRGFTLDYDPVPQFVGAVTSISPSGSNTILTLNQASGYPDLDSDILNEHWSFACVLDPDWQNRVEAVQGRLKPDTNIVWSLDKNSVMPLGEGLYQVTVTYPSYSEAVAQLAVGDRLVVFARTSSDASPVGSISSAYRSSDVAFEGLTVYAAPAGHFQFHESPGGKVLNCVLAPKSGRWMGGNADGVHCFAGSIGPWIEGCDFEAIGDDAVALYSKGLIAKEVLSSTSIRIWPDNMYLSDGDRFRIFSSLDGEVESTVYTLTAEPSRYPVTGTVEYYELEFSPALSGALETSYTSDDEKHLNDQLFSITERNASFMVRNNRFAAIRRYGCAVRSANGAIVGNHFQAVSSSAIVMVNEANYWRNGPYNYNILIADNTLSDGGYDQTARDMAGIHLEFWKPDPTDMWGRLISEYMPNEKITIRDNLIECWENDAILLGNAATSHVAGNVISTVRSPALLPGMTNRGIYLRNTYGAVVSDNDLLESGLSTADALEIPTGVNWSTTVENNKLP